MKAAVSVAIAILVGGTACKKDNEDLKKKVTAIRDKALACTDAKCASAARDEYIGLTKDLSGLSDADATFFADLGTEIGTLELKLSSVPAAVPSAAVPAPVPSAAAPASTAAAATSARETGPGFSLVLPAGWTRQPADDMLLAASGAAGERRVSVMRLPKPVAISTQAECETFGAELKTKLNAKEGISKAIDLGTGPACSHIILSKNVVMMSTYFQTPEGTPFQLLCIVHETDKTGAVECSGIPTTFAFEKT